MKALPGQKNWLQKIGDGIKNFVHGAALASTPGAIPAQINTKANLAIQGRREALQIQEMKLSVLKHEDNKTFQVEMVQLSHENQQKLEEYRAMVQLAVQDKNINFQKWKLAEEKTLQLQIINIRQEFDREIARYNRETALIVIEDQRKSANFPITLVPDHLLKSPYRDGVTMPLRILLSPPELNYDSFGQQSFGFKIENQLAEELRQFLDNYYSFNDKNRRTQLLDGAWVSKNYRGGSGIQALWSQLKAVPTVVLESEVDGNYLNFRVAYWRGDSSEYQYKSILSGFPYRDFLYDSVRERARKWQVMKQLLLAKGKTLETVKAIGGDNEFNLFILQEEQQLLDEGLDLSNSDIQKQYKVSETDFQKLHKYLITCHCLTASVIADIHYLAPGTNATPLLPTLLEELLKDVPDSNELQTSMLDWLLTVYNQMYERLEEVMAGWIPELILQFAVALTSLEDKSYAKQQAEQSVKAWLRLHGMETLDRKSLHSIVTKDDEPYFKSLQEFLEQVKDNEGLTQLNRLLESWSILDEFGIVQDSPKVNINDIPREEAKEEESPPEPDLPGEEFSFEVVTVNSSGNITKRETKTNRQRIFDLGNGVKLEMVYIPEGSFMMGAPAGEKGSENNERPQHEVTLEAFWMAKYPITQAQYRWITVENPSRFKGDNNPVENVSHADTVRFCDQLSLRLEEKFKLPSEAQWEYACRAGTKTPFHFGETISTELVNYNGNETTGHDNKQQTTPVGYFQFANNFGLYDMHGNVWEWCEDHWHDNYENAPTNSFAWLSEESDKNVIRGGYLIMSEYDPFYSRSAIRKYYPETASYYSDLEPCIGFRVVCIFPKAT